jgi:Cu(I)/Ag(I) efflux system membrane fusion protein
MKTNEKHIRCLTTTLLVLAVNLALGCASRYDSPAASGHPGHPGASSVRFEPPLDPLDVEAEAPRPSEPVPKGTHDGGHSSLSPPVQPHVDRVVTAYLAITQRLAGDSSENVGASLDRLRSAAAALSRAPESGHALMATAADVLAATPLGAMEIEPLRETWQELSRAVIALVEIAPPTDAVAPQIVRAYCPMVSAPWLQTEMDLRNPYYGSSMLRCGRIDDVLPVIPMEKE